MNIEIHDDGLIPRFMKGEIVFKISFQKLISPQMRDLGMVTTKEDYEQKLSFHQFIPLIFLVNFYEQLAYLYGCANLRFSKSRDSDFTFWWRELRTKEWKKWFTAHPYKETMFRET